MIPHDAGPDEVEDTTRMSGEALDSGPVIVL